MLRSVHSLATDEWLCILCFLPLKDMVKTARIYKDLWKNFVEGSKSFTRGCVCYSPCVNPIFGDIRPVFVRTSSDLHRIYTTVLTSDSKDPMKESKEYYLLEHGVALDEPVLVQKPFCKVLHFTPSFDVYHGKMELPMDMPLEWIAALATYYNDTSWYVNLFVPYSMHSDSYLVREEESINLSELLDSITMDGVWLLEHLTKKRGEKILRIPKCTGATITLHISWLPNQAVFEPVLCSVIFCGTSLDEIQCDILPGVIVIIDGAKYYLDIRTVNIPNEHGMDYISWLVDVNGSCETTIDDVFECAERLGIAKRNIRVRNLVTESRTN